MALRPKRRVLIVDDSETARLLLRRIVEDAGDLTVVGEAKSGEEAITAVHDARPDVVVMDVVMPGLNGFEATRRIMADTPTPIVIVTGSLDPGEVAVSMQALSCGALVALQKPAGPAVPGFEERAEQLRRMVRLMSEVKVVRRRFDHLARPRVSHSAPVARRPDLVAIATSTGGPGALHAILKVLPSEFRVPIVVVQHIARGFAAGLARWLDAETELRVQVGKKGMALEAGHVYISPDDGHLGMSQRRLRVDYGPAINGFRPSGDHLFTQVAQAFGASAVGVILTGMGADGTEGLKALRRAGGVILAQDEATSVVWSMPKVAIEAGLVDEVLPITAIGARLLELVGASGATP